MPRCPCNPGGKRVWEVGWMRKLALMVVVLASARSLPAACWEPQVGRRRAAVGQLLGSGRRQRQSDPRRSRSHQREDRAAGRTLVRSFAVNRGQVDRRCRRRVSIERSRPSLRRSSGSSSIRRCNAGEEGDRCRNPRSLSSAAAGLDGGRDREHQELRPGFPARKTSRRR